MLLGSEDLIGQEVARFLAGSRVGYGKRPPFPIREISGLQVGEAATVACCGQVETRLAAPSWI
jgi:hypothetical protein